MTETPDEVRARQTATALNILPAVFENPIWPPQTCALCKGHSRGAVLSAASAVVPLPTGATRSIPSPCSPTPGRAAPQARQDLRQYKDGYMQETRDAASYRLSYLVWYFAAYHATCMATANGKTDLVALVPSGHVAKRAGAHPLTNLDYFPRTIARVDMVRILDAVPRQIDPESLRIDTQVAGKTVLLFDDTWTTGASTQSAAVALKRAGAAKVNAVVIGRWLNGGWPPTDTLMSNNPAKSWDPDVCPVTGKACP